MAPKRRRPPSRSQAASPTVKAPDPLKPYYKIGEVAELVGVEPHVLRFWEREFRREIRPERSGANQRRYRHRDVETFLQIKALRYDEKLQIKGARRRLRAPSLLRTLEQEIRELLVVLDDDERR